MSDNRDDNHVDSQGYFKLAQLYTAITQRFKIEEVDGILQNAGNINYQFPENSYLKNQQPELIGSTILHFAISYKNCDFDTFQLLLNYGADYTLKNKKGSTALHHAVQIDFDNNRKTQKWKSKIENKYVSEILSRQVQSRNPANPCSSDGMSHFHVACMTNHQEAVSFFLENGTAVGQAVSTSARFFPGYTPLHFAVRFCAEETVEILLRSKATLDIQDARGLTPMHVAIERRTEILDLINIGEQLEHRHLSTHMEMYGKITKQLLHGSSYGQKSFVDIIGLTHFHIICTLDDTSMVERCLEQIDEFNRSIKFDAPVWPGCTALHFAALFKVEILQLLLKNGANIRVKDANGILPFDICIKSYKLSDIHSVLSNEPIWKNILFSDGKTSLLDVIMDMDGSDTRMKLDNMNIFVPFNSSLWPGYTPLHIAVIFSDRVKDAYNYNYENDYYFAECKPFELRFTIEDKYLARGAALNAKDANGSTPLHLAFRLQKTKVINRFTSNHNYIAESVDNDNLSHLHVAAAANKAALITQLLKSGAAVDLRVGTTLEYSHQADEKDPASFFIPKGSTALHIAAATSNQKSIKALLEFGANVYARDANGMTPIHRRIVPQECMGYNEEPMLKLPSLKNCIDDSCNLSHLHVACYFGHERAIERLLSRGADINAAVDCVDPSNESLRFLAPYAGFTPLHFALASRNPDVCKLLVEQGADIFAQSSNGVPLLYERLTSDGSHIIETIYSILEQNEAFRWKMFEETGLTMLHFVCYNLDEEFNNFGRWLGEYYINARSHDDSPVWPGCTALDVWIKGHDCERGRKNYERCFEGLEYEEPEDYTDTLFEDGFLKNGADVTLVNGSNTTAVLEFDRMTRAFKEEKVDVYESYDSHGWGPRYYDRSPEKLYTKRVKVKLVWNNSSQKEDEKVPYSRPMGILLKGQQDFTVNPANAKGISHFHVACLYKYDNVIGLFLKHNVNVNSAVSVFSDEFPGCTPLHLTMIHDVNPELIQLLLDYGADVHARDVYSSTPLHYAAKNSRNDLKLFEIMISKGADVNARNLFGDTPLNVLLDSDCQYSYSDTYSRSKTSVAKAIEFFLKKGYRVNSFNPVNQEGWIRKALSKSDSSDNYTFSGKPKEKNIYDMIASAPDLMEIDDFGRTPIHNISSYSHTCAEAIGLLKVLSKHGCDVDRQDVIGRSALHIAVQFTNIKIVSELLKLGADINLKDSDGKVPFAYCFEASTIVALRRPTYNNYYTRRCYQDISKIFAEHIRKLQLLGLDVCRENVVVLEKLDREIVVNCSRFSEQLERSKHVNIKYSKFSFKLHDMLSETKIVAAYPNMLQTKRRAVNKFFKSDDVDKVCEKFDELFGFLKLQYKKAVERGSLTTDANKCLKILAGSKVAYCHSEMIVKYLSNTDLKNLRASVSVELLRARRRF